MNFIHALRALAGTQIPKELTFLSLIIFYSRLIVSFVF
jgi:hypothetical protein